ncbi:biotin synthase BioB, partial [Bacillus safensis]
MMREQLSLSWEAIAEKAMKNEPITVQEGLDILKADDRELLPIMHAAYQVRFHFFQKKVKLNMIFNAKSGYCPENCGYCSQSMIS